MKKICFVLAFFVIYFLPFTITEASMGRNTLLFVPLDNRPVCLDYAVETMQAAGWNVETPPLEYIASSDHSGNPDKLYEWLAAPIRNSQCDRCFIRCADLWRTG